MIFDNKNNKVESVQYYRTNMQRERILDKLKAKGYRITKQRVMLIHIILENDCASSKDIYYRATQQNSTIGLATVYRMINTLEEIGAISRKNMYKVNYSTEKVSENNCVIVFEDGSEIILSVDQWSKVLQVGLEANGYSINKAYPVRMRYMDE